MIAVERAAGSEDRVPASVLQLGTLPPKPEPEPEVESQGLEDASSCRTPVVILGGLRISAIDDEEGAAVLQVHARDLGKVRIRLNDQVIWDAKPVPPVCADAGAQLERQMELVAAPFSMEQVRGPGRGKGLVAARRRVARYLAGRQDLDLSLPDIGGIIGRHHTTILNLLSGHGSQDPEEL